MSDLARWPGMKGLQFPEPPGPWEKSKPPAPASSPSVLQRAEGADLPAEGRWQWEGAGAKDGTEEDTVLLLSPVYLLQLSKVVAQKISGCDFGSPNLLSTQTGLKRRLSFPPSACRGLKSLRRLSRAISTPQWSFLCRADSKRRPLPRSWRTGSVMGRGSRGVLLLSVMGRGVPGGPPSV